MPLKMPGNSHGFLSRFRLRSLTFVGLVGLGVIGSGTAYTAEEALPEAEPKVEEIAPVEVPSLEADDQEDPVLKAMRDEIERLNLEQQLADARLQKSLREISEQSQRLAAQQELNNAKQAAEVADLQAQVTRLQAESAVAEAKHQDELRALRTQQEKQALEVAQQEVSLQQASFKLQEKALENKALTAQFAQEEMQRQQSLAAQNFALTQAQTELNIIEQQKLVDAIIPDPVPRPMQPFQEGVLSISDRRIDLNEPIILGTGDWIARRINFFNKESAEQPIFIVIDYCPGGSIMEGEIILRAMRASKAPVHLVVKTFAASMAAVMVSEAQHSYVLPNAMIMHHQPWSYNIGNLAEQKEWVKRFKMWAARLHSPTAKRMGITLDEFYEKMYEESVTGDWTVFGDEALELKWVQQVAQELVEEDVSRKPDDPSPMSRYMFWSKEVASADERVRIPRLRALDGYFLYNRDGRFYVAD